MTVWAERDDHQPTMERALLAHALWRIMDEDPHWYEEIRDRYETRMAQDTTGTGDSGPRPEPSLELYVDYCCHLVARL